MILRLLLLCALVALASESAYGLGLGKLELHSALNQRLDADIALTNTQGLETGEIIPSLASSEDFDRVGVDRTYELTDLRFAVEQREGGQFVVHVSSTKPVVEPFLDFLVEVLWPNGRILREYTVLLDPPVFGKSGVEPLAAPGAAQAAAPAETTATPATATATTTSQAAATSSAPTQVNHLQEGSSKSGEYGVTGPGDTLWKIALKVRPNSSVSVQQTMLAIKRANPNAFINDNINLLKAGRVLRIPDLKDIKQQTMASAVQEVKAQNEAFDSYKSGGSASSTVARLDASRRKAGGQAGSGSGGDGELRLLASDKTSASQSGRASGDQSNGAATQQLQNELDVTKEDLDRAKRANTDLNGRVTDLQDQITKLNQLVKLKDDQLAALRAEVQKMQAASEARPAATKVTTSQKSGSLLTNPLVLGLLALLVVGGVAGGMVFMRRRRQMDSMDTDDLADMTMEEVDTEQEAEEPGVAEVQLDEEEEELSPQTTDVISEAEIYIAYGRFPQAITFLQNAIDAEPRRADIQLKLLEVYAQTEDATAFNLQLEQLKNTGDEDAIARAMELQQQIPGAAEAAEVAMDATIVSNEPITAIEEPADDDDELSFDLDDLDVETEDDSLDLSSDLDLDDADDLDLDLDLDGEEAAGEADAELSLDDADLDLDLEADSTEEELELDLDADEGEALSLDDTDLEAADLDLELEDATLDDTDDEIVLDLGDDEEIDLDGELSLDDDDALNLDDDAISLEDDDAIELDLGDDDDEIDLESDLGLDADSDDGAIELDLGDDDEIDLAAEISLDDDDAIELDLGDDDDAIELDLDDDDDSALDLSGADEELSLDDELDLDDDLELNLDEDASTKLDLARAYIDMGDSDGAKSVLQDVIKEGNETEIQEANELLEKLG